MDRAKGGRSTTTATHPPGDPEFPRLLWMNLHPCCKNVDPRIIILVHLTRECVVGSQMISTVHAFIT